MKIADCDINGIMTVAILVLLLAIPITAQIAPQPDKIPIDHKQQRLADRYLEAIEQLEIVLDDYGEYFADIDLASLKAYQISFDQFSKGIQRGTYAKNPQFLMEDLGNFIEHLAVQEDALQTSDSQEDKKLRRLLRGLRRELAVVLNLVEDSVKRHHSKSDYFDESTREYVLKSLEAARVHIATIDTDAFAKQYQQAIKVYLTSLKELNDSARLQALVGLSELEGLREIDFTDSIDLLEEIDREEHGLVGLRELGLTANIELMLEEMDRTKQEMVLKALENFEITYTDDGELVILFQQELPESPPVPSIPSTLMPRKPRPGSVSKEKLLSGSLGISSYQTPIYITHPVGELKVVGYEDDIVVAQLSVSIEALSEGECEKFLRSIVLKMDQHTGGYHIETSFPQLSDPSTSITESRLEIKVPTKNRIICDHSFGEAVFSDLSRGALVKGNNSSITISNIAGKLKVENKNGPITIDLVEGPIQATNIAAPIFITSCEGRTRINNSAGLISITDSEGDVVLSNSGDVKIANHIGDIDIDNRNGSVTVLDVEGNLSAYTTLQPLLLENIVGEVVIENSHGDVDVFEVNGPIVIHNSSANITAEDISGPVKMINDHGEIMLRLGNTLKGSSDVTSNSGLISLIVPSTANILLKMEAVEGRIKTKYKMNIDQNDQSESGVLKLGSPKGSLTVKNSHSAIVIEKR